jgi:hypothetical protein
MSASGPKRTLPSAVLTTSSLLVSPVTMRLLGLGGAMKRREFITMLGGAAAALAPFTARAQPVLPTVGFMSARSPEDSAEALAQFHKGLGEGGFVEGRNVTLKYRWARGDYGLLPGYVDADNKHNSDCVYGCCRSGWKRRSGPMAGERRG